MIGRREIAPAAALMLAMGVGRFAFTPILPTMIADGALSVIAAGWIAAANFAGYLAGALLAAAISSAATRERLRVASLVACVLTTAAMAVAMPAVGWSIVRFAAGVASAFAMVFTIGAVMAEGARGAASMRLAGAFAGVGLGIAASSLLLIVLPQGTDWSTQWSAMTLLAALLLALAQPARASAVPAPAPPAPQASEPRPEPLAFWLLVAAYGLLGFGYVIHATFLPTLVRAQPPIAPYATEVWLAVGLAAAGSVFAWARVARRHGARAALVAGFLIEAAALIVPVFVPGLAGVLIAGAGLGATFVGLTSLAAARGAQLAPIAPTVAFALLTGSFGVGQILGPIVAAATIAASGDFVQATVAAVVALVAGAALAAIRPSPPRATP